MHRLSVRDSRNKISVEEEFQEADLRVMHSFLLVILMSVGCSLVLTGILSWYFDRLVRGSTFECQ